MRRRWWSVDHQDRRSEPTITAPIPRSTRPWGQGRERRVQACALLALLLGAVYLTWRVGWSGIGANRPLFLVLLAAESFGWLSLAGFTFVAWSTRGREHPPPLATGPVDIFVCTYDEPVSVVEATLVGCRAIPEPHVTHLLDDGRRPEMAGLAARLGARYVTRRTNVHAKAGNINHALRSTRGELVLVLDADHVPLPTILSETTGYFADPDVALVQTPHDFSNRDSIQHTRPERHEQSLFYEVIAPGKDHHGAMFWCGSATVLRRAALVGVGGVLTDTVAEDFHTTIAMHARGWRTRYHDRVLVQGRAPHDLAGFLLQRARWARGNLAVFRTRENPITCRGLTARQRASYLVSLGNHLAGVQRLALFGVLVATLVSGALPMRASLLALGALWLPWTLCAFVATMALGRGSLGPVDSTRYGLLTMGLQVRGALSLLRRDAGAFRVTPKEGVDEGWVRVLSMLGLLTTTGLVLATAVALRAAEVVGLLALPPMPTLATAVVLALGTWELACIARAVVPVVRRRQRRVRYRTPTDLHARVAGTMIGVSVVDLTPEGLAFDAPVTAEVGEQLRLLTRAPDVEGRLRDLELPVEIRSVRPLAGGGFRMGARMTPVDTAIREALVELCDVVLPARGLGHDPLPTDPGPEELRRAVGSSATSEVAPDGPGPRVG